MRTMKSGLALAMMSMLAASQGDILDNTSNYKPDYSDNNHTKKCFRNGCNNKRSGNKLYCSAECCKLDKQNK